MVYQSTISIQSSTHIKILSHHRSSSPVRQKSCVITSHPISPKQRRIDTPCCEPMFRKHFRWRSEAGVLNDTIWGETGTKKRSNSGCGNQFAYPNNFCPNCQKPSQANSSACSPSLSGSRPDCRLSSEQSRVSNSSHWMASGTLGMCFSFRDNSWFSLSRAHDGHLIRRRMDVRFADVNVVVWAVIVYWTLGSMHTGVSQPR